MDNEQAVLSEKDLSPIYDTHGKLFQHYSLILVRARNAIITIIFLSTIYIIGSHENIDSLLEITLKPLIPYVASNVIALLFTMETHYSERLFQVIVSARSLERKMKLSLFFTNYDKAPRWPINVIYFIAIVSFDIYSIYQKIDVIRGWWLTPLAIIFFLVPITLFVSSYRKILRKSRSFLE